MFSVISRPWLTCDMILVVSAERRAALRAGGVSRLPGVGSPSLLLLASIGTSSGGGPCEIEMAIESLS